MKKITFTLLLASSLFLTACNSKKQETVSDSSSSLATSSSTEKSSSTSTSEIVSSSSSVVIEEQSTQNEVSQSNSPTSELSEEQALQRILETNPDVNNDDISFMLFEMIDNDFLFEAKSKSIEKQGGSGTVGFYRVTPQGAVTLTDSTGNPL